MRGRRVRLLGPVALPTSSRRGVPAAQLAPPTRQSGRATPHTREPEMGEDPLNDGGSSIVAMSCMRPGDIVEK